MKKENLTFKNWPIPASFSLFSSFPHDTIINSIKASMVCLGLKPGGGRMEGADESTERWWHPKKGTFVTFYVLASLYLLCPQTNNQNAVVLNLKLYFSSNFTSIKHRFMSQSSHAFLLKYKVRGAYSPR